MSNPSAPSEEISARLAAMKVAGDAGQLWPHVTSEARLSAQHRVLVVTSQILAGTSRAQIAAQTAAEADALGIAANALGMGGLLGHWIETGRLEADAPVRSVMAEHLDHGRRRATLMRDRLTRVVEVMNAFGIEPIVLKGSFTAGRYFPEPGTRPNSDIDLLVEPEAQSVAREALTQCGMEQHELGPGQSSWRPRAERQRVHSLLLEHAENPWSVDLHSYIDRRYFWGRWSRFGARPYRETRQWTVDGRRARAMTHPMLAAHLAHHAVHDFRAIRLIRIVELIEMIRRDTASGELRWDRLAALLDDTRTADFAFPAFALCARIAPGTVDADFGRHLATSATARMRRVVDRWYQAGVGVRGAGSWDERLMWARTPLELIRNVAFQVARRANAAIVPVSAPRLRSVLDEKIGLAASVAPAAPTPHGPRARDSRANRGPRRR